MSTLVWRLSFRLDSSNFMAVWALGTGNCELGTGTWNCWVKNGRIFAGHRPTCKAFYNLIFIYVAAFDAARFPLQVGVAIDYYRLFCWPRQP